MEAEGDTMKARMRRRLVFSARRALMVRSILATVTLLCGLAICGNAARADEDETFQRKLFGRPLAKERLHACFKRVYDAGHLAAHKEQNVRTMLLLITGEPEGGSPRYEIAMGVTFRKSGQHFESRGNCGSLHNEAAGGKADTAQCGVECDGGSIDVAIRDATSVRVSIPAGARVWRPGAGDDAESETERGHFGSDDKLFRLDKTRLTDCINLAFEPEEKAALRRGR
jgi:hypothetical protein